MTNGGWLRSDSANGFRKCLAEEFSSIYVFDLRGNQRTQGEKSRKEGGKIFGSGSRAPVAITLLVKNPASFDRGTIYYHDIGDYLSREEKLSIVQSSVAGECFIWDILRPDKHGDWLEQRNNSWYEFAPVGLVKMKDPRGLFEIWSSGLKTERDIWAWNYSAIELEKNMRKTILFYEKERARRNDSDSEKAINDFVEYDEESIKWNRGLLNSCNRNKHIIYSSENIVVGLFRPYCKQWLYFAPEINGMTYQIPKLFPKGYKNLIIDVCDRGALVSSILPDLEVMHHGQCFPLYWYEKSDSGRVIRHDAITDEALAFFRKVYPAGMNGRLIKNGGPEIRKEDIFYYVYGILHSPEYQRRFEANLKKELPRIPLAADFSAFSIAGRALANLHINYESVEPYNLDYSGNIDDPGPVEKMRWGKKKNPVSGKMEDDKTVLVYNSSLTYRGIPEITQRYVVNGRTPLEWMIDRYQIKIDKATGIINDPNTYSDDPSYISTLIRRLVTLSVETMQIVDAMLNLSEKDCYIDFPEMWKTDYSPSLAETEDD